MRVQDAELCKAIEESAFHQGMESAKAHKMQENYRMAIKARLMPRAIDLVQTVAVSLISGNYRQSIVKARKLVALMERISLD